MSASPGTPTTGVWSSLAALWWACLGVALVAAGVAPFVVTDPDTTVPAALPVVLAASFGIAALVGILALDRGLAARPPADDQAAVTELRMRLVLQGALSEVPVAFAVVLAVVVGPPWVATVGALPSLLALLRVFPGRARLARLDAAWHAAGADVSLRRAHDADRKGRAP